VASGRITRYSYEARIWLGLHKLRFMAEIKDSDGRILSPFGICRTSFSLSATMVLTVGRSMKMKSQ
jgi:hypothetical protein